MLPSNNCNLESRDMLLPRPSNIDEINAYLYQIECYQSYNLFLNSGYALHGTTILLSVLAKPAKLHKSLSDK